MDKKTKSVNLNIRVTDQVKEGLQELADQDKRTLSDFIRLKLEELVEKGSRKKNLFDEQ